MNTAPSLLGQDVLRYVAEFALAPPPPAAVALDAFVGRWACGQAITALKIELMRSFAGDAAAARFLLSGGAYDPELAGIRLSAFLSAALAAITGLHPSPAGPSVAAAFDPRHAALLAMAHAHAAATKRLFGLDPAADDAAASQWQALVMAGEVSETIN